VTNNHDATTWLTPAAYQKLQDELEQLTTVGRRESEERIAEARSHGDIRENAEYDVAKNDQGLMEARIRKIQGILENAQVEQGASFLDAALLHSLGDLRVLLPADRAVVEELYAQALAGQVRFGEDRHAALEPDALLRALHREPQRALVALSPQIQQQARHGQTRELPLLRNLGHHRSVSGDCGSLLRGRQ